MSDRTNFTLYLKSPRWGSEDGYEFELEHKLMSVGKIGPTKATLTWVEGRDPVWSEDIAFKGNALLHMLENDSIYPPSIFLSAVEFAWKAWRNYELNDEEVKAELEILFDWVNHISKSKPASEFWKSKF